MSDVVAVVRGLTSCNDPYQRPTRQIVSVTPGVAKQLGAVAYGVLESAGPLHTPFTKLAVGQVPHEMKAPCLRWVVQHVTGVLPRSVKEVRGGKSGRRPTGMYHIKVAPKEAAVVLSKTRTALCCARFLLVPTGDAASTTALADALKAALLVRTGLLTFALADESRSSSRPGDNPIGATATQLTTHANSNGGR